MKQCDVNKFFSKSLPQIPAWQIIVGQEHTLFFNKQNGDVYGLGLNKYYSLGIMNYPASCITKIPHRDYVRPCNLFASHQQSFILYEDGKLYATGRNSSHQLGNVAEQYKVPFREVLFSKDIKPIQVAVTVFYGNFDTLFLTQDRKLYSYKDGEIIIPDARVPKKIAAAENHILILCKDMSLYGLGFNCNHGLGRTNENRLSQPQLIQLAENIRIKDILAKGLFSLILTEDKKLYFSGQCLFDNTDYLVSTDFKELSVPEGVIIKNVYAGEQHIIIQSTANKLYGYGNNNSGQLGLGEAIKTSLTFQEIKLPDSASVCDVATGYYYTFVVCENDEIYGFGDAHIQLGEKKGAFDFLPRRLSIIEDLNKLSGFTKPGANYLSMN